MQDQRVGAVARALLRRQDERRAPAREGAATRVDGHRGKSRGRPYFERAHKTVLPWGEAPLGAPRSGSI